MAINNNNNINSSSTNSRSTRRQSSNMVDILSSNRRAGMEGISSKAVVGMPVDMGELSWNGSA